MPATLKELRTARQLSQPDLAKLLGIHRVTVCRYETGELQLPKPIRFLVARIFDVHPDDIIKPPVKNKHRKSL